MIDFIDFIDVTNIIYAPFIIPAFIISLVINYLLPRKYRVNALKSKPIVFGSIIVDELTILEWKPLFSLKTFYYHPGDDEQEIFLIHDPASYSLLLYGNYTEKFYYPDTKTTWETARKRSRITYIPKDQFYRIPKSIGCRTVELASPWFTRLI